MRYHAHSANLDPAGAEKVNCPLGTGVGDVPRLIEGG
jgi:hypothetical protein